MRKRDPGAIVFAALRALAAPLLADDEQQTDARLAGRAEPLGRGNLRDERCPSHRRRRARTARPPASRLGKNGGTQSKWVEKTTTGRPAVAKTLKRPSTTGCRTTS